MHSFMARVEIFFFAPGVNRKLYAGGWIFFSLSSPAFSFFLFEVVFAAGLCRFGSDVTPRIVRLPEAAKLFSVQNKNITRLRLITSRKKNPSNLQILFSRDQYQISISVQGKRAGEGRRPKETSPRLHK